MRPVRPDHRKAEAGRLAGLGTRRVELARLGPAAPAVLAARVEHRVVRGVRLGAIGPDRQQIAARRLGHQHVIHRLHPLRRLLGQEEHQVRIRAAPIVAEALVVALDRHETPRSP